MNVELKDSVKSYKAPKAKVVEFMTQAVICTSLSNGINGMTIDEDGGESFN